MKETCQSCRFYHMEGAQIRSCRRYPDFQYRDADQWCGEYQPKEVAHTKPGQTRQVAPATGRATPHKKKGGK